MCAEPLLIYAHGGAEYVPRSGETSGSLAGIGIPRL